jgi:hypothetical protein
VQGHQLLERVEHGQHPPRTASEQPNNYRFGTLRVRQGLKSEKKKNFVRISLPPRSGDTRTGNRPVTSLRSSRGKACVSTIHLWTPLSSRILACCRFVVFSSLSSCFPFRVLCFWDCLGAHWGFGHAEISGWFFCQAGSSVKQMGVNSESLLRAAILDSIRGRRHRPCRRAPRDVGSFPFLL